MSDELDETDRAALLDLLDVAFYRARYADGLGDADPAEHFLRCGWKEGLNPSASFDAAFYLAHHAEVAAAGYNPVLHYARFGRKEGRAALPALLVPEEARAALAPYFDAHHYLRENPDVAAASVDPLYHFYVQGWREGRNPSAAFDVAFYRATNPDLASHEINPLLHYALYGRAEGRRIQPAARLDAFMRRELEKRFDAPYYLQTYTDVRDAGVDPLMHFHDTGWLEGRNPSRAFDVRYYLRSNPDVAAAGVNPLLHYCYTGAAEGRAPRRPQAAARRQIDAAIAPSARCSTWVSPHADVPPLSAQDFAAGMADLAVNRSLIVSISHDDYRASVGGVQNLIGDEVDAFEADGVDYLHLSPAEPSLALAAAGDPDAFRFFAELNRGKVGVVSARVLAAWLARMVRREAPIRFVVHHLMGHDPEAILLLLDAAQASRPLLWIHDFFTVCPSYALMRNDVAFCGGPPPASGACKICCYGPERTAHLARIAAFFEAADPLVVAPSRSAREWWAKVAPSPSWPAIAAPLAALRRTEPVALDPSVAGEPIRVAHLGGEAFHKGWSVFEDLAERLRDDPRYEFYRLGRDTGERSSSLVRTMAVSVDATNRDAMISAVAAFRIDVVVNWALWPETFNFTTFEALAGGAFVVTHRRSGNVWRTIESCAPDQGCAVEDTAALIALFAGGELVRQLGAANRRRGTLVLARGSADLVAMDPGPAPAHEAPATRRAPAEMAT